jgi:hypothetical protein
MQEENVLFVVTDGHQLMTNIVSVIIDSEQRNNMVNSLPTKSHNVLPSFTYDFTPFVTNDVLNVMNSHANYRMNSAADAVQLINSIPINTSCFNIMNGAAAKAFFDYYFSNFPSLISSFKTNSAELSALLQDQTDMSPVNLIEKWICQNPTNVAIQQSFDSIKSLINTITTTPFPTTSAPYSPYVNNNNNAMTLSPEQQKYLDYLSGKKMPKCRKKHKRCHKKN